jgi:hemolysin III
MENKTFKDWLIKNITLHQYDNKQEEFANALTHGLGIVLSITATIMMILKITNTNSSVSLTGALIFGFSMVLLYSSSTFYHLSKGPVLKRILRIMDHSTIYFLIAGTYTPVALTVGGTAGWTIFGIEWALTLLGITFTLIFWGRYGLLHVLFYIIMGWLAVFIWNPLMENVNKPFIILMISGGLSYTLGTIIYGLKKLPFHHAIWHLFVLAGSVLLFLAIYLYLM